jgi:hypothetical protein
MTHGCTAGHDIAAMYCPLSLSPRYRGLLPPTLTPSPIAPPAPQPYYPVARAEIDSERMVKAV